jgi:hypothetical protein
VPEKGIIRTIHHLASSGGTIISKTIAAQPGVVFLSEMNPSHPVLFSPLDPFPQLLVNYPDLFPDRKIRQVFAERIMEVHSACAAKSMSLVVRDHSHTDFTLRQVRKPGLRKLLIDSGFEVRSIATLRHPIDVWLSMSASGFNKSLPDFTTYCQRVKLFADNYKDLPLFRYEDFTANTDSVVEKMVRALDLVFDPEFGQRLGEVRVSGDSGRLRNQTQIQVLQRRQVPDLLREEANRPENVRILTELGYGDVL